VQCFAAEATGADIGIEQPLVEAHDRMVHAGRSLNLAQEALAKATIEAMAPGYPGPPPRWVHEGIAPRAARQMGPGPPPPPPPTTRADLGRSNGSRAPGRATRHAEPLALAGSPEEDEILSFTHGMAYEAEVEPEEHDEEVVEPEENDVWR
jgi:hypothetical protein